MTYYVKTPGEDEPKGPFDVKEIVRHIENAWVPENALIAVPGTHEWIPIKQVPDFAAAFAFLKKVGLAPPEAKSPKRERKKTNPWQGVMVLVGAALWVSYCTFVAPELATQERIRKDKEKRLLAAQKEELAAARDAECRQDIQCWGSRNSFKAAIPCAEKVEQLAQNSHQWTDSLLESKFHRFRWVDQNAGIVRYIGDRVQFQNGFGAWVNHQYFCDFNTEYGFVVDQGAAPGRLQE
jgi:hypothetical protein